MLTAFAIVTSVGVALATVYWHSGVRPWPAPEVHGLAVIDGQEWAVTLMRRPGQGGLSAIQTRFMGEMRDEAAAGGQLGPRVIPAWARRYVTHPQTGVCAAGWPWYCLRGCNYTNMTGANELHSDGMVRVPLRRLPAGFDGVYFPWHVWWPGMGADAAVYGGLWWTALFGLAAARRAWRRARERCAWCGYDLRGSTGVCPECGSSERAR